MAPPAKKAKTDEEPAAVEADTAPAPAEESKKEPESPKELEQDAPASKKALISEAVKFHAHDTTMNVLPSTAGGFLKPLTDGGLNQLLAGARANVGVKSGRYMFEVKIVEQPSAGKPMLRIGFATSSADLLLGLENEESVSFDTDGMFVADRKKLTVGKKFTGRDTSAVVLLNLDKKSPNFNTVSLFKDGVRHTQPQALPDALKGKTLFPVVTFRGMTLAVNFTEEPLVPLPFKCRLLGASDQGDADIVAPPEKPKDGKYEVLYPVGLPDEGAFDWLDIFLKKNPQYTEVSERSMQAWSEKSGVFKKGGANSSRDKPMSGELSSMISCISNIALVAQRDFVIMELKGNLLKETRESALLKFPTSMFKRVAVVVVGEPPADFKKYSQALILKDKQSESDKKFNAEKAAEKAKWIQAKKAKEAEKAKKKAEKARLKVLEAQKKKVKAAQEKRAAELKAKANGEAPPPEEEKKEEEKPEEPEVEEEEEVEEEIPEPKDEDPPKVSLDSEEKQLKFHKASLPDLVPMVLSTSFTKFSLPVKDEGFDEIRYEWNKGPASDEYLRKWILNKKQTTRIEELLPSTWFHEKRSQWEKALKEFQATQTKFKALIQKKVQEKNAKIAAKNKKIAAAKAAALKKEADKKKKEEEAAKKAAEGAKVEEEAKEAEPEPVVEEEEEDEDVEMPGESIDFDGLDVFGADDVNDIGEEMPLYKEFANDDWTMAGLRFEIAMLVHAFSHDVNDPERTGIHIEHLAFYYNKYFKKQLTPKSFGVDSFEALIDLVSDTVYLSKQQVVETLVPDEFESWGIFMKLTEEARRNRLLAIDAGDETARLKLTSAASTGKSWENTEKKWDGNKGGNKNWSSNKSDKTWDNSKGGGKSWDNGKGGGKSWGKQQWGGGNRSGPYSKGW